MSWLAIKYGIQKAWVWCRNNWKIVMLAVYTILLYLLFSKNARNAKKVLETQRLAHKTEIAALNKSFDEERKKKDENLKKYQEILRQIEQEYAKLLKTNDIEAITQKKKEIDFYENVILLASSASNKDNKITYD